MSQFYQLTIKKIVRETSDAVSILFDVPVNLQQNFSFIAGQYITVKAVINGEEVRRAYSLCSSPKSNEVKIVVKAIENGKFSMYATTQLKTGDVLEVSKPEGKFTINPKPNKNYIGFSAGSGITPVLSIIKSVLESEPSATFTLVYGNKSIDNTIFYLKLNELKKTYPEKFNLHYIFSREAQENTLFGRIDKGNTNYFIKNVYKEINFNKAFLCGPEEMVTIVSETLLENNFLKENIHYELFTASENSKNTSEIKDGNTEITVLLDDDEVSFSMEQTQTILAAALNYKLDPPYSCQGGVCGSCTAKVIEGKVIMEKNNVLTDDELEDGLILTCQAYPTTSIIKVDFDDV